MSGNPAIDTVGGMALGQTFGRLPRPLIYIAATVFAWILLRKHLRRMFR